MKVEISDNIKYIGASVYDLDLFESQYIIPNGMAYNSYVILDDKIALWILLTSLLQMNGLII